jgi:UDP-N-acetylglucosamine/UDP-N-acetylgalactosamine diphosphorylase
VSSKALHKANAEEKIGSFVRYSNGSESVVEYSDLPKEKMYETKADGSLAYTAGSIAIHLFERKFIETITSGGEISLPFHVAKKKIKEYSTQGSHEIDGFKFEKFVFDALPLAKHSMILETLREEEFAPVKNASGVDSVESSKLLVSNLCRSWLSERKIHISEKVKVIEISPLVAVEAEDLDASLVIPDQEQVYIG